MIPIPRKSSKLVYMKINQIHKFYGKNFSIIFKSITFDNGSEFSRYKDMEYKPGHKEKRTSVYFGRPYHSCDWLVMKTTMGSFVVLLKKEQILTPLIKHDQHPLTNKSTTKKEKFLAISQLKNLSKMNLII